MKITIDGKEVEVAPGETVLQACLAQQVNVPYFCYHDKLSIAGNCRMCLVGIEGSRKLEISCNTPVREGMVVHTNTPEVLDARKSVLEFILINHPLDCPICDQAGECDLQDQYFDHSAVPYRFREEKVHKPKAVRLGDRVMLDDERCIVCTRCVRFCDEVAGTHELAVAERGDRSTITTFENRGMHNAYSVNTVDICPVGALTNRDFRFTKRSWFLSHTDSICTGCATGCNITIDHEKNILYRYRPRENANVNSAWMCDEGRFTYKFGNAADRIEAPYVKENGAWTRVTWEESLRRMHLMLAEVAAVDRGVVLSAQCSNEENYAWWWLANDRWKSTHIFSTRRDYAHASEDTILRHRDKNPNSAGVVALGKFSPYRGGPRLLFVLDTLSPDEIAQLARERLAYVIVLATNWGTDPHSARWFPLEHDEDAVTTGGGAELLDALHVDPAKTGFPWADLVLPLAAFAEQSGTFTNAKGLVQSFAQAIAPKGIAQPAWQIAAQIAGIEKIAVPWDGAGKIAAS